MATGSGGICHWSHKPILMNILAGVVRDQGIGVASVKRFLVSEVFIRAEDVVGGEIEALGARIEPARRPSRHFSMRSRGTEDSEDERRRGLQGFRLRVERGRERG